MWTMFCMEKSVQSYKATMKSTPTERVTLDIMGPLHVSLTEQGNRYILVIGDYFTKWTKAYASPDQEAETVAKKLVLFCGFNPIAYEAGYDLWVPSAHPNDKITMNNSENQNYCLTSPVGRHNRAFQIGNRSG